MNSLNVDIKSIDSMEPENNICLSTKSTDHSNSKPESPPSLVSSSSQSDKSPNLFTITLQNITEPNQDSTEANSTFFSSQVSSTTSLPKGFKDERRRSNHNEVERRRRDNINKWIVELSKVIPECCTDQSKHGQSKSGILEKTVQYLVNVKEENEILSSRIRNFENLESENEILKRKLDDYIKENEEFKKKLQSKKTLENNSEKNPK